MESDQVLAVVKFGPRQYVEDFAKGSIYMNSLKYFVELEEDDLRRDVLEGTTHLFPGDGGSLQIKIDGSFSQIAGIRGAVRYRTLSALNINVFCMTALRNSPTGVFVDARYHGFGDTFAIVTNFDEFKNRLWAASLPAGQELSHGLVTYYDEGSYLGPVGAFSKVAAFSFQREFRIALSPGAGEPLRLEVGSLSDILVVGELSGLNSRLRLLEPK